VFVPDRTANGMPQPPYSSFPPSCIRPSEPSDDIPPLVELSRKRVDADRRRSSPLAGEDRRRRRQMRGTRSAGAAAIRRPARWGRPSARRPSGASSPSSGPSGHLPPRGGKDVHRSHPESLRRSAMRWKDARHEPSTQLFAPAAEFLKSRGNLRGSSPRRGCQRSLKTRQDREDPPAQPSAGPHSGRSSIRLYPGGPEAYGKRRVPSRSYRPLSRRERVAAQRRVRVVGARKAYRARRPSTGAGPTTLTQPSGRPFPGGRGDAVHLPIPTQSRVEKIRPIDASRGRSSPRSTATVLLQKTTSKSTIEAKTIPTQSHSRPGFTTRQPGPAMDERTRALRTPRLTPAR